MSVKFKPLAREIVDAICTPDMSMAEKGQIMRLIVAVLDRKLAPLMLDIKEFHEWFLLDYKGPPRALDRELHSFRHGFMQEELDEYQEAYEAGNLEGQFDALIDLTYVALGTAYLQGFPFGEGWKRVHAANMGKVRVETADESKRQSRFDVKKPAGWKPPVLSDLVGKEIL